MIRNIFIVGMAIAVTVIAPAASRAQMQQTLTPLDTETLLRRLHGDSPVERLQAISTVGERRLPEFVGPVTGILDNRQEPSAIREAAATALFLIDPARGARVLRTVIADATEEPRLRESASRILIRSAYDRFTLTGLALTSRLATDRNASTPVRVEAMQALSFMAPTSFTEPFLTVAQDSAAPASARATALRALGQGRHISALSLPLLSWLDQEHPAEVLVAILETLATDLNNDSASRSGALEKLRAVLDRAGNNASLRAAAMKALGSLGDVRVLDILRDAAVNDPAPRVRGAAVYGLGRLPIPTNYDALVAARDVKDAPETVRTLALEQMCLIAAGAGRELDLLTHVRRTLEAGTDVGLAIRCLRAMPNELDANRVMLDVAESKRPAPVRVAAIRGLVDRRLVVQRLHLLNVPLTDDIVRAAVIVVLATMPNGLNARWLIDTLRLKTKPNDQPLSITVRIAAAESLHRVPAAPEEVLAAFVVEREPRVRQALLGVLAQLPYVENGSVRDGLLNVVDDRTADRDSRRIAAVTIARTLPPSATPTEYRRLARLLSVVSDRGEAVELRVPILDALTPVNHMGPFMADVRAVSSAIVGASADQLRVRLAALQALTPPRSDSEPKTRPPNDFAQLVIDVASKSNEPIELRLAGLNSLPRSLSNDDVTKVLRLFDDARHPGDIRAAAVGALVGTNNRDDIRAAALRVAAPATEADRRVFDGEIRINGVFRLAMIADDDLVFATLARLGEDQRGPEDVRTAAAFALAESSRQDRLVVLGRIANDPSALVRWVGRLKGTP